MMLGSFGIGKTGRGTVVPPIRLNTRRSKSAENYFKSNTVLNNHNFSYKLVSDIQPALKQHSEMYEVKKCEYKTEQPERS